MNTKTTIISYVSGNIHAFGYSPHLFSSRKCSCYCVAKRDQDTLLSGYSNLRTSPSRKRSDCNAGSPGPSSWHLNLLSGKYFRHCFRSCKFCIPQCNGFFTYDLIQSLPNRASTFLPYSSILLLIGTIFLLQLK